MPTPPNLFAGIPASLPDELFQTLLQSSGVQIERIVSHGHSSAPGFWYDQETHEWVVLLSGAARLRFEGEEPLEMTAGSFVNIPAHQRHRIEWTMPDKPTVWLAIHYSGEVRVNDERCPIAPRWGTDGAWVSASKT